MNRTRNRKASKPKGIVHIKISGETLDENIFINQGTEVWSSYFGGKVKSFRVPISRELVAAQIAKNLKTTVWAKQDRVRVYYNDCWIGLDYEENTRMFSVPRLSFETGATDKSIDPDRDIEILKREFEKSILKFSPRQFLCFCTPEYPHGAPSHALPSKFKIEEYKGARISTIEIENPYKSSKVFVYEIDESRAIDTTSLGWRCEREDFIQDEYFKLFGAPIMGMILNDIRNLPLSEVIDISLISQKVKQRCGTKYAEKIYKDTIKWCHELGIVRLDWNSENQKRSLLSIIDASKIPIIGKRVNVPEFIRKAHTRPKLVECKNLLPSKLVPFIRQCEQVESFWPV